MVEAILRLDGIEMRTTDQMTCRTLYRLMQTADGVSEMVDPPKRDREPVPVWTATID